MGRSTLPQLAAFALVADEYERSGDAVKGLRPLFVAALSRQAGSIFSPEDFARAYEELFGASMQAHVGRSLESKLIEMGLLQEGNRGVIVSPDLAALLPSDAKDEELPSVLSAFSSWASSQFDQKGLEFAESELEQEFLARISRPEFAAGFFDEDSEARSSRIKAHLFSESALIGRERDSVFDYLVAKFIIFSNIHAPDVFDSMARVSSGALIAEAVAGLASPSNFQLPSGGLRVVIDGPLLLDYLDLNTPQQHTYVRAMLDELRELGFMLVTFDHVIEEMRLLINAALKEYSAGREYGPLGDRLRSEAGFSTYATIVRDSLEKRLDDALGLRVLRYELYDQGDRDKYFSGSQLDSLRNALGDAHHQLERRQRDAKSIAGVVRLKKENRRPASIFNAGTIFLTRNSRLFKDATRFLTLGRSEADPRFAVALDSQLMPIVWFSRGAVERFSEMSRARLIANCAAAMVPQREVVHKLADYLAEISPKLREEFSALMSDERAKLCPMSFTLGISSIIDQQSAADLLDQMKAELTIPFIEESHEKEVRYREVIAGLEERTESSKGSVLVLQEAVSRFDTELAQAILDRENLATERAERDRIIEGVAVQKEFAAADLRTSCDRQARLIRQSIAIALWVLVFASAIYTSVSDDRRGYFIILGSLLSAGLFGTGQAWADDLVDRLIDAVQASRRRRAAALECEAADLRNSIAR